MDSRKKARLTDKLNTPAADLTDEEIDDALYEAHDIYTKVLDKSYEEARRLSQQYLFAKEKLGRIMFLRRYNKWDHLIPRYANDADKDFMSAVNGNFSVVKAFADIHEQHMQAVEERMHQENFF